MPVRITAPEEGGKTALQPVIPSPFAVAGPVPPVGADRKAPSGEGPVTAGRRVPSVAEAPPARPGAQGADITSRGGIKADAERAACTGPARIRR